MPLSNEWDARTVLNDRFGKEAVWDLYNTYWDSWITKIDFKNITDAGLNGIRLPIYALNHLDWARFLCPRGIDRWANLLTLHLMGQATVTGGTIYVYHLSETGPMSSNSQP